MPKFKIEKWRGINTHLSSRSNPEYLEDMNNLMVDDESGELVSRKGYEAKLDTKVTILDKFIIYQDEAWGKDVLVAFNNVSAGSRNIWVYTRTIDTDNQFVKLGEYDYGSSTFSSAEFLQTQNSLRIGTGTVSTDKALFASYLSQEMFNNADFTNSDFYLLKQQWVQQANQINYGGRIEWDASRERFYVLTTRGVEIKDSDFHTVRILEGVVTFYDQINLITTLESNQIGNCCFQGDTLYACGRRQDSDDYGILMWDISSDYKLSSTSITRTAAAGVIHHICCDSSNVYECWQDKAGTGYITEYTTSLGGAANRATLNDCIYGIALDSTYVFVIDKKNTAEKLVRMHRTTHATTNYSHGKGSAGVVGQMHSDGTFLHWTHGANYYTTTISTFANALAGSSSYTGDNIFAVSLQNSLYYFTYDSGIIEERSTGILTTNIYPGKVNLQINSLFLSRPTSKETYFYGVSVVDHLGQESHLMYGGSHPEGIGAVGLVVNFMAESEKYSELSSPTQDPADNNSIWGMYRRIKKIKIYRAFAPANDAAYPTTNYTFLTEIDIDDARWVVNNPSGTNYDYAEFTYLDNTAQSDISSVTYEESSGLQETFKPYYTNWKHAANSNNQFYYGNVYTDDEYISQIIQTGYNQPDVLYQLPTNIEIFSANDGTGISAFASIYNRLWIFKESKVGLYNGLVQEYIYDIGTTAPGSVVTYNNVVYFISNNGIYALSPDGYERISLPIDDLLASESSVDSSSATYYKRRNQLWFHAGSYVVYVLNLNSNTWEKYTFTSDNSGNNLQVIYNGDIYADSGAWVFKHDTTTMDDGAANIVVSFTTKDIPLGAELEEIEIDELFTTYLYNGSFNLNLKVLNDNGLDSSNVSLAANASNMTTFRKFIEKYGQSIRFGLTEGTSSEFKLRSIGVSYIKGAEVEV